MSFVRRSVGVGFLLLGFCTAQSEIPAEQNTSATNNTPFPPSNTDGNRTDEGAEVETQADCMEHCRTCQRYLIIGHFCIDCAEGYEHLSGQSCSPRTSRSTSEKEDNGNARDRTSVIPLFAVMTVSMLVACFALELIRLRRCSQSSELQDTSEETPPDVVQMEEMGSSFPPIPCPPYGRSTTPYAASCSEREARSKSTVVVVFSPNDNISIAVEASPQ